MGMKSEALRNAFRSLGSHMQLSHLRELHVTLVKARAGLKVR